MQNQWGNGSNNWQQQQQQQYQAQAHGQAQVKQGATGREKFIVRTYNHLFGAIVLFAAIEFALFQLELAPVIAGAMMSSWWLVLGGFMLVSWVASRAAFSATNPVTQYAALGGFVLAEAIIFVPLLYMAEQVAPGAIPSAGLVTMAGFAGLTGIAFWTRKDFSFLGGVLRWAFLMAMVAIGASLIFGASLGTWFSVAMVAVAGAAILYDTSNVLRHFPEDRHVGAALQLFASVALMFWYVLSIFISRD